MMGVPKNSFHAPLVTISPRTGRELIVTSHDLCDPTTWYTTSERVVEQTMSDAGGGFTWSSPHNTWIDMSHGKLWDEDALCEDVSHGYTVSVTSDGAPKTQRAPFAASGGDYVVDYRNGTITFASSQEGRHVVASYSRMVDSVFILVPDDGTLINVECAEVQFSLDVVMNDTIDFEIWAYNPYDLPNKVNVKTTAYKRMVNFLDESAAAFPVNPAMGGPSRGAQSPSVCLQFRYSTSRPVSAAQGVELRIRLRNDQAFGGEHAAAALYCTVSAE